MVRHRDILVEACPRRDCYFSYESIFLEGESPMLRCSLFCRRLLAFYLLFFVAPLVSNVVAEEQGASNDAIDVEAMASSVTIYRDAYGSPHIDGPTDESVVFGFAYCQAEDYFWQLEDSYIMGMGRYAEIHGEAGLRNDLINRAFEIPRRSREDVAKLDPESRGIVEAFTAGVNHYLDTHPEVKPRLIKRFEPWHLLAFGRQVVLEMGWGKTGVSRSEVPTVYEQIAASKGSNAWAIAPEKTASGNAMLFCNPHQPYYGFGQFYEAHLRSGEGWNFSGATFFGSPIPTIGHNEHLGWSFTVNEPKIGNAWRVTFDDPENPLNYRYDGGYREAVEWTDTIKVKKRRKFETKKVTFRKTHHGPIVKKLNDTEYLAANIGKFYDVFLSRQSLKMIRARNLDEFLDAMSMLELHIFNTVYADCDGNIMYLYNGIVPKRDPSFDWNRPVDGSNPKADWQGIHPIADLPKTINPLSHFVQNCNQSPFTTTDDGNPSLKDFPNYMVGEKYDDKRRAKVSRMLLREMDKVTFADWQRAAFDTTMYWPLIELPKYGREYEQLKQSDPEAAQRVAPYIEHLLNWNCKCSIDSTEATLCLAWYEELYGDIYRSEQMTRQYVGNPGKQFDALVAGAKKLEKTFGDWKIPYGDINRIQRHANVADLFKVPFTDKQSSIPAAGVSGPLGTVFTMYFTPTIDLPFRRLKKHYAVVGCSYVSTIEFGDHIQAGSQVQYGSSGNPKSPHFADQAEFLSSRTFRKQLFYWDDVVAGAKQVYHPGQETAVATTHTR